MDKINLFESEPFKIEPIFIKEVVIQISSGEKGIYALTNFGNIYFKIEKYRRWEKIEPIDFDRFNND